MAGAGATALPAPVLQKTKHHILDTIAAMVSGTTLKPGRLALQYAEEQGGKPEAQVIGSSLITSAVTASLANGMLDSSWQAVKKRLRQRHSTILLNGEIETENCICAHTGKG